ncbi:MAG: chorismate mutase [Actinocrinis sp.]
MNATEAPRAAEVDDQPADADAAAAAASSAPTALEPASAPPSHSPKSSDTRRTHAPSPAPSSSASPSPSGVLSGRERIDALDAQIAELVARRIEVSRQIQTARIADGGRRVDLRRETEVIARYSAALGRPGTAIAMALLELGRGRA